MTAPPRRILCPYCGTKTPETEERCVGCGGFFDDLSRRVTQQHMGPWFVRDPENPFRPGCSYSVIAKQVEKGKITAKTILRGPSTRQFWTMAGNAPGVAHLLGHCHACGKDVPKHTQACPHCGAAFPRPDDRNELGLDAENPRVFEEAARAQAEFAAMQAKAPVARPQTQPASSRPAPAAPAPAVPATRPAAAPARTPATAASAPVPAATVTATQTFAPQPDLDNLSWMTGDSPNTAPQGAPTATIPEARSNLWVWALVGVNLLLAVGVVFFLLKQDTMPADPATEGPPANPFNDTGRAPAPPADNASGNPAPPTVAVSDPSDAPPVAFEPTNPSEPAEPRPTPPGSIEPDPSVAPPPATTTPEPSGAVSFFGIKSAPGVAPVPQHVIQELDRRFSEGNELFKQRRYDEALRHFEALRRDIPPQVNAIGLDAVIEQVRQTADKARSEKKGPGAVGDDFFDG